MSKMEQEQTTIRLEPELMNKLRREADEKGYTVRDLIVFILWNFQFIHPLLLLSSSFTHSQRILRIKELIDTPSSFDFSPIKFSSLFGSLSVNLTLLSIDTLLTPPFIYIISRHLFGVNRVLDFFGCFN